MRSFFVVGNFNKIKFLFHNHAKSTLQAIGSFLFFCFFIARSSKLAPRTHSPGCKRSSTKHGTLERGEKFASKKKREENIEPEK